MTALLEVPDLDVVELAEEEHVWSCDLIMGSENAHKPPCLESAVWLGSVACSCLTAACEDHKAQFEREQRSRTFLGSVRFNCADHGLVTQAPPLIVWSHL